MQTKLILCISLVSTLVITNDGLIVTTYNLWNHMFLWDVRKMGIREMIRDLNPHIVAFQEVRSGLNPMTQNQVEELQTGLNSRFKWNIFRVANNVSFVDNSIHRDYPGEGLGLISQLTIRHSQVRYLLPSQSDPDKNKRLFLHVAVTDQNNHLYSVIVVHLSYHRQQQCRNIEEIINYINTRKLFNVIIMGDFNTYQDFEGPVQMLLAGEIEKGNPCSDAVVKPGIKLTTEFRFVDVGAYKDAPKPGYTFSNMPTPGLESRPDRILISSNLRIRSVHLDGNGTRYRQRYSASVHWERLCTVLYSSYLSYQGASGYPCLHDCGPHGACQCGVCVAAADDVGDCQLPHCELCSQEVFRTLVIHAIACAIVLFHLSYAVVVIFVVAGGSYGETLYAILGCNCCLMNPKLFTTSTRLYARKYKILGVCKCWPLFKLPPYVQLLVSLVAMVTVYVWTRSVLAPQLDLAYGEMAEEMFPSDHLMLTADIKLPQK